MSLPLTEQERHNLAMNIVGKDLEAQGFEFLAVNSTLKKNPQFVVLKDKTIHFIVVKAITFPNPIQDYDKNSMLKMKMHADKFEAKTFYAGVGLGHGSNYQLPILKDEYYTVVYHGLQEIVF
ncbi:MAG: Na(+)-translocating NADH-quinone reductase subunit F [Bacteroidetes bacterium HGW-Bacteroidetes-2]|jgi:hypothetical protein|nr:MAG: Na(+)-translocating NADH-quinone reductase subunit F [Bacteroidetes bacterium HGW-Bacteroidetes-2]